MVGFSLTASNRDLTLLLARRIRERYPNKKIIFGGYAVYLFSEPAQRDAACARPDFRPIEPFVATR